MQTPELLKSLLKRNRKKSATGVRTAVRTINAMAAATAAVHLFHPSIYESSMDALRCRNKRTSRLEPQERLANNIGSYFLMDHG